MIIRTITHERRNNDPRKFKYEEWLGTLAKQTWEIYGDFNDGYVINNDNERIERIEIEEIIDPTIIYEQEPEDDDW